MKKIENNVEDVAQDQLQKFQNTGDRLDKVEGLVGLIPEILSGVRELVHFLRKPKEVPDNIVVLTEQYTEIKTQCSAILHSMDATRQHIPAQPPVHSGKARVSRNFAAKSKKRRQLQNSL